MKKNVSSSAKRWLPLVVLIVLGSFLAMTVFNAFYDGKAQTGALIARDIQQLAAIFKDIQENVGIIDFDEQKSRIDFLTIKKGGFVSSEVGAMNLVRPERWNGPYLQRTPTMQNREYQVVRTNKGHFITPGDHVRLPNNTVIGADIILDEHADINALIQPGQPLNYQGKALAAEIKVGRPVR